MNQSALRVIIYSSGTTVDTQATKMVMNHKGMVFTTLYPGGLYGTLKLFIPFDPTNPHNLTGGMRVEVRDGLLVVWEGEIDIIRPLIQGGENGIGIECTGKWGSLLARRRWNKIWCDNRITDAQWKWGDEIDQFRVTRQDAITIFPVGGASVAVGDDGRVTYTLPTGQTLAHITYDYNLFQGSPVAEDWHISAYDITNSGTITGTLGTASGTGSINGTPSAGCASFFLQFECNTAGTVDAKNGAFGKFSNIKVYSELGTISPSEVIKDIRAHYTEINADETRIGSNSLILEPLFMESEKASDFLSKIASYGDASFNPWAAGVLASTEAATYDGKPVLYYEQQPVITDYDYVLRSEEIEGGVELEQVFDEIWNWIIIEYNDANNAKVRLTPDDDANLKDTTSIASYGQRDTVLQLGNISADAAKNYARRYLAWFKDPKWRMSGPIRVKGTLRTKGRGKIPACQVRAGQRVMLENILQEMTGTGPIFLITGTSYDEDSQLLTITAGSPDPLAVLVTRMRAKLIPGI